MQMFQQNRVPPQDRRRERVYGNFRSNLEDILRAGVGAGAGDKSPDGSGLAKSRSCLPRLEYAHLRSSVARTAEIRLPVRAAS